MSGHFFDELATHGAFNDAEVRALRACHAILAPHFDDISESFYRGLLNEPRAREVFSSPEQVERLRASLLGWLESGFTGPWDDAFFARRRRIARTHVDVGLLPQFVTGAMSVVRRHVRQVLVVAEASLPLLEATERLLQLELELMQQSYWDHMMELKLTVPVAFASGLAHEIRNPLNAIVLNLKILERRLQALDADHSIPIVEAARDEVRRIASLTDEIIEFAKPMAIRRTWHRADRFLAELETLHAGAFRAKGVSLRAESSGEATWYCDVARMLQALTNLLANALDAVQPGGQVLVSIASDRVSTTIEVIDDGRGMAPAVRYRIFDIFYTQDNARGMGLGLSIVRNIVDAHGGLIDVRTLPGAGSTFTIRLPRPYDPQGDHG